MNTADKTVLITGANRGIGHAMAHEALRRGAKRVYAATRSGEIDIADPRVTPLMLDVTDPEQIRQAAEKVVALDILVNNAGIAIYDNLSDPDVVQRHLDVNLFGMLRMTQAFLPQLKRSRGAIVNHLSIVALASLPIISGYSLSKASALNMTQSLRAQLASHAVRVHAVLLGPIDTDMNRGLDIPKATTASAAHNIFDGLESGEEDIFPDPTSRSISEGWRNGVAKALERQFAPFVPASAA
jgi:NAD(P)-dependent dehydrogenase (short-subunit alcohol dehydrogenase family)